MVSSDLLLFQLIKIQNNSVKDDTILGNDTVLLEEVPFNRDRPTIHEVDFFTNPRHLL